MGLLDKPHWHSKLDVLGAHLPGESLKSLDTISLLLWKKLGVVSSFLVASYHVGYGLYGEIVSQPLLTISLWDFPHLPSV